MIYGRKYSITKNEGHNEAVIAVTVEYHRHLKEYCNRKI